MTKKIFRNLFIVAMVAVFLSVAFMIWAASGLLDRVFRQELQSEASYIAAALAAEDDNLAYFNRLSSIPGEERITLIAQDGTVLFDSASDASQMENHLLRPEVQSALQSGAGKSERISSTLGEKTFYYALRLNDGSVLRLSSTQQSVLGLLGSMVTIFLLIVIGTLIVCGMVANRMAKNITRPIKDSIEQPESTADI